MRHRKLRFNNCDEVVTRTLKNQRYLPDDDDDDDMGAHKSAQKTLTPERRPIYKMRLYNYDGAFPRRILGKCETLERPAAKKPIVKTAPVFFFFFLTWFTTPTKLSRVPIPLALLISDRQTSEAQGSTGSGERTGSDNEISASPE